jgi:hypothetical protein
MGQVFWGRSEEGEGKKLLKAVCSYRKDPLASSAAAAAAAAAAVQAQVSSALFGLNTSTYRCLSYGTTGAFCSSDDLIEFSSNSFRCYVIYS